MFGDNQEQLTVDLYIRVSTDRQATEGDSLKEQEEELKKFCDYRKYRIHRIYIERGKSGGNTNRPEYQKLIQDVKAQKIQAVVVKKLDRLSRSLLDFEHLMKTFQENNVEFISLKESFDTTSAMGKAMLRIALVFCQLEREQTSERLIDVMAYRASRGLYNGGMCPYGYQSLNKEMIPYNKEKIILEQVFDKFLETHSVSKVARYFNDLGIKYRKDKLWDKRRVHDILKNETYKGMIKWKGRFYPGLHQPLISEKKFDQVQLIFKSRSRLLDNSKSKSLLQKLIYCPECEAAMSPCYSYNWQKVKYFYYRCTSANSSEKGRSKCKIKYLPMDDTDQLVIKTIADLPSNHQFIHIEEPSLKYNQDISSHIKKAETEIRVLEQKREGINKKKDKLFDSLMADGFNSSERKRVNQRIDELYQEDQQLKNSIIKLEYDLNQFKEDIINLSAFKQQLITFRNDHAVMSKSQIKAFLNNHITRIAYFETKLWVQFKILPWPILLPVQVLTKKR